MYYERNKIAHALTVAGWLIIVFGILGALMLGAAFPRVTMYYTYTEESYNWALALGGSAACGLSGLLLLGMSEIIFLLDSIGRAIKKSCDTIVAVVKEPEEKTS